ncbi:MAG: hypothetical protein ACI4JF_10275 [Oscillospiraceae bacterium]
MKCPKCSKIYNNHLKFCISCGTELVPGDNEAVSDNNGGVFDDIPPMPAEQPSSAEQVSTAEHQPSMPNSNITISAEDNGFVRNISMTSSADKHKMIEIPIRRKDGICGRALKKVGAAALSLLLFAALGLGTFSSAARALTDKENIRRGIDSINLLDIPFSEMNILSTDGYEIPQDATLEEAIMVMTAGSGVNSGNIRKIYESSTLKPFLTDIAADYGEYIRSGVQPGKITAAQITSVLKENLSIISAGTGQPLSEADIALACEEIERSSAILEQLSVSGLEMGESGRLIRLVRAFMSVPVIMAELGAAVLVIALMYLLLRSGTKTAQYCGTAALLCGGLVLAFTFLFSMQIGPFSAGSGLISEVLRGASAAVSPLLWRAGVGMAVVGAAAIIWAQSIKHTKWKLSK